MLYCMIYAYLYDLLWLNVTKIKQTKKKPYFLFGLVHAHYFIYLHKTV